MPGSSSGAHSHRLCHVNSAAVSRAVARSTRNRLERPATMSAGDHDRAGFGNFYRNFTIVAGGRESTDFTRLRPSQRHRCQHCRRQRAPRSEKSSTPRATAPPAAAPIVVERDRGQMTHTAYVEPPQKSIAKRVPTTRIERFMECPPSFLFVLWPSSARELDCSAWHVAACRDYLKRTFRRWEANLLSLPRVRCGRGSRKSR